VKFTNPLERDFIRARYKWDKEKKIFYMYQITRKLIRLLQKHHQLAAESPTSPMRPKWDSPLNRALDELKGLPLSQRPQYGHVHGAGDGATWKVFYNEGPEAKKKKKKFSQADIDAKVKLAVEKKVAEDAEKIAKEKNELLQQAVSAAITTCRNDFATNLVPAIINWTKENPDKTVHDFPMPSFIGSNSMNNNNTAPSLAHATGPPLAVAPAHSSPYSVSGALGGPASLAELDAVTVITCCTNIYIYI